MRTSIRSGNTHVVFTDQEFSVCSTLMNNILIEDERVDALNLDLKPQESPARNAILYGESRSRLFGQEKGRES